MKIHILITNSEIVGTWIDQYPLLEQIKDLVWEGLSDEEVEEIHGGGVVMTDFGDYNLETVTVEVA